VRPYEVLLAHASLHEPRYRDGDQQQGRTPLRGSAFLDADGCQLTLPNLVLPLERDGKRIYLL